MAFTLFGEPDPPLAELGQATLTVGRLGYQVKGSLLSIRDLLGQTCPPGFVCIEIGLSPGCQGFLFVQGLLGTGYLLPGRGDPLRCRL